MQTYQISIDECQRQLLVNAIAVLLNGLDAFPGNPAEPTEDTRMLCRMLVDLPAQEAAHPGVLHGLCL